MNFYKMSEKQMENAISDAFDNLTETYGDLDNLTNYLKAVKEVTKDAKESGRCHFSEVYVEALVRQLMNVEEEMTDEEFTNVEDALCGCFEPL